MNYWYFKIPRFDGCKTLAFNGIVFGYAAGELFCSSVGLFTPLLPIIALWLIGLVAACNVVLRLLTDGPVRWKQAPWLCLDPASGESETVYARAADFISQSDFTDVKSERG